MNSPFYRVQFNWLIHRVTITDVDGDQNIINRPVRTDLSLGRIIIAYGNTTGCGYVCLYGVFMTFANFGVDD